MNEIKLAVIREGKVPPDKRVPLTPKQCIEVMEKWPHVKVIIESSEVRAFPDDAYSDLGIPVVKDVSDCDIMIGVKEVNIEDLIPSKKYLFFSHTYKEQPYNRKLLQALLDRNIQLIDYEVMTDQKDRRIIGFGRYAGIVGCYNGFLAYGKKHGLYNLKPANQCEDRKEMESELDKVNLPSNTKIVATGFGRVGNGAREIFARLNLKEVSPTEFLNEEFTEPVYTQLKVEDYYAKADGSDFDKSAFFKSGEGHIEVANMYVACHYWDASSPFIFTRADLKLDHIKTTVVSDISCDIDGPVASTLRPSTIADPLYGYDPDTEKEVDFMAEGAIGVQAVDNLPCELPKDASEDFGSELINNVFQSLFVSDDKGIIERASETTLEGELAPRYAYLEDYLKGK
jgi:saccharopine dehydrogenase (NAD+, L-lysine-forming)